MATTVDRFHCPLPDMLRGDTYIIPMTIRDDHGDLTNLEGRTIFFTMKLSTSMSDEDADLTLQYYPEGSDAQNGKTTIVLPAPKTHDLLPTAYWYDIQMTLSDGSIITILRGKVKVYEDVTRAVTPLEIYPSLYGMNAATLQYPYGDAGLAHNDPLLNLLLDSFTGVSYSGTILPVSSNLSNYPDPLPDGQVPITVSTTDSHNLTTENVFVLTVEEGEASGSEDSIVVLESYTYSSFAVVPA